MTTGWKHQDRSAGRAVTPRTAESARSVTVDAAMADDAPEPHGAKLPVTVLSGFLGSGKTTLLKHVLENRDERRCAVLVNDLGSVNLDEKLIKESGLVRRDEELIELSNGCMCCTRRDDLVQEVRRVVAAEGERPFECLVVESSGVSDPAQVVEAFLTDPELDEVACVDTLVTVVDAANFQSNFYALGVGVASAGAARRGVSELLVSQVEFASLVVLNKCDLASESDLSEARRTIRRLNPTAEVVETTQSRVEVDKVLGFGRRAADLQRAMDGAGWLRLIRGVDEGGEREDGPAGKKGLTHTEDYGLQNFVYRRRRPFHPKRLRDLLSELFLVMEIPAQEGHDGHEHDDQGRCVLPEGGGGGGREEVRAWREASEAKRKRSEGDLGKILRSKGSLWLASRHWAMCDWGQAGVVGRFGLAMPWFATIPEEHWPDSDEAVAAIRQDFVPRREEEAAERVNVAECAMSSKPQAQAEAERAAPCCERGCCGGAKRAEARPERHEALEIGDRRQEVVFIGVGLREGAIVSALDSCLLTDSELKRQHAWQVTSLEATQEVEARVEAQHEGDEGALEEAMERAMGDLDLPPSPFEEVDPWEPF